LIPVWSVNWKRYSRSEYWLSVTRAYLAVNASSFAGGSGSWNVTRMRSVMRNSDRVPSR
jgi:hypothetical protein